MSKLEPRASSSSRSPSASTLRSYFGFSAALGLAVTACAIEGDPDPGTGGVGGTGGAGVAGSTAGTGGSKASAGGTSAGGGSGGTGSAGKAPTAGTAGSAGTANPAGGAGSGGIGGGSGGRAGSPPAGGSAGAPPTGGSGGTAGGGGSGTSTGGMAGMSGTGPTGGMAGTSAGGSSGATGGGGSGGTGSGDCQKGTTMGNEVLFIGESFIAASSIPEETTNLARDAGMLSGNDSYVDRSVSGTWIGNTASNSIPNQYRSNSNGVRFVLMNGGGNDCWQGGQESHRTAALNAAETLFGDMAENGVEKIVNFFYPDPIGSQLASPTA
jgi:hypothetical protein